MIPCECGECGSTYKVKDQNAGKRFKCKYCESMVTVPSGGKPTRKSSAGGPPKRRKKAAKKKRQQEYDDYEDYSADEYESYDDYDSYDDGHDDYGGGYDDYDEPPRRRRPAPKKKKKKKKRRESSWEGGGFDFSFNNFLIWLGLPFALGLIVTLCAMISKDLGGMVGIGVTVLGYALNLVGGVKGIIVAFREDAVCGLMYLFVPFYALYYLISRWDEMAESFRMQISGVLMIVFMLMVLAAFS